jgi:hypothetical protein
MTALLDWNNNENDICCENRSPITYQNELFNSSYDDLFNMNKLNGSSRKLVCLSMEQLMFLPTLPSLSNSSKHHDQDENVLAQSNMIVTPSSHESEQEIHSPLPIIKDVHGKQGLTLHKMSLKEKFERLSFSLPTNVESSSPTGRSCRAA